MNNGLLLPGHTRNMSGEGVFLETQTVSRGRRQQSLKAGEFGILTLQYKLQGNPEALKVPCRIAYVSGDGLGIHLNISRLSAKERKIIEDILESGTGMLW